MDLILLIAFGTVAVLAWLFAEANHWGLDPWSFAWGIFASTVTGFALFRLNVWWSKMKLADKPQKVFVETKETPNQVVWASTWATIKFMILLMVLGLGVAWAFGLLSPVSGIWLQLRGIWDGLLPAVAPG